MPNLENQKRIQKKGFAFHMKQNRQFILLCLPAMILLFVFCYIPMAGISFSFFDFNLRGGINIREVVGFDYFIQFFKALNFSRIIKNTVLLSTLSILISFPIPIIFALMLNEVRSKAFKRTAQTITYMPHFISTVIVVSILQDLVNPNNGIINQALLSMNVIQSPINFMMEPKWFRTLYIGSDIWQHFGWNSILYLAALSSVDQQLYEAATIDGAGKWKQLLKITLPCISPVIVTMLILSFGSVMNVGFEKVWLMMNDATRETAEVIATYTYEKGIIGNNFGFGTAVGLLNAVINLILLVIFNKICRKVSEVSLW